MAATNDRTVTVFGGTGFLGRRVFGISISVSFPFGLRQGIQIEVTGCLVVMIRNFNRSKPTFRTSDQSPMHLLALTAW